MKKIQVIGLPGAGKTTAILEYKERAQHALSFIDIKTFSGYNKERCFKHLIQQQTSNTIAESACGIHINGLYIIRLNTTPDQLEANLRNRGDSIDKQYQNYLLQQMMPSNYTVSSKQDLVDLLRTIFHK